MIVDKKELEVTQERIQYFQRLLEQIREKASPNQFELMASGYRLEIERMQAEVMDYLLRPLSSVGEKTPA
jgi:uncharacterized membrane protein (DUF106 family)